MSLADDEIDALRCPYCGDLVLDAERAQIDWNETQRNLQAHAACARADEDVRYSDDEYEPRKFICADCEYTILQCRCFDYAKEVHRLAI